MEFALLDPEITIFLSLIIGAFITWFAIPIVVKVTSIKRLMDKPGNRKIHKRDIPTLGGVAIYAGFSCGFLITVNGQMDGINYLSLATLLLFLAGMKDDLITLDPNKKLLIEIISSLLLIYFTGIKVTNFHGFLNIAAIPWWASYCITIFIFIVIINSINLIDGIDGLAATTGIIASCTFGTWFWLSGQTGYSIMSAALAGALGGFLRFNLSDGKFKIFMGDTGSLLVGFILAAMTILFNEVNTGQQTFHRLYSAPAISIAILIIPLYDTLRVFTIRIYHGQHPFTADNRHVHHLLLRAGYSHKEAVARIAVAHVLIIAIAFFLDHIGILWLSLVLLLICLVFTGLVYMKIYRNFLHHRVPVKEEDSHTLQIIASFHTRISGKIIHISSGTQNILSNNPVNVLAPGSFISKPKDKNTRIKPEKKREEEGVEDIQL